MVKKITDLTAKEPETMGDYITSEARRIFPDHSDSIVETIRDICPNILVEKFKEYLCPQIQQLVFMTVTGIIEKLAGALLQSAYDESRKKFVKKTGTSLKRIK